MTPSTAPKVGEVVEVTSDGFAVFGGQNAQFVLEEYARGAVGTMPACEFTDVLAPMQPRLAWAVHKEVLVRRGIIDTAVVRDPAAALDDGTRAALDDILRLVRLPELPRL